MPKGSAVDDVENKLKSEYGEGNPSAVYGTLNKAGLMHGNKPTAKGLKPAHGLHTSAHHTQVHEHPHAKKKR